MSREQETQVWNRHGCAPRLRGALATLFLSIVIPISLHAQETDITQTPNAAGAGIQKSFTEQIGLGRGDSSTPDTSLYLIARDPFRAIVRGRQLFQRKFTLAQGLGPRTGDGVGDIELDASHGAGLADSCAACHGRPQGSAGFGGDVFTRPTSRDAPHLFGLGLQEMLADEITADLRAIEASAVQAAVSSNQVVTFDLTSKGIDYGAITALPDGTVDTGAVDGVDEDLRVRPFFAEGTTVSIREFAVGAFNAEMGLESPDPDVADASAGFDVLTPSGMLLSGSIDNLEPPPVFSVTEDSDGDGLADEIPTPLIDVMEFYLLNYFRPAVRGKLTHTFTWGGWGGWGGHTIERDIPGLRLFKQIGCANCHVQDLQINVDRRVADTETTLDYQAGNPFNNLFTEAIPLFQEVDDGSGLPTLKTPIGAPFLVENIFTDFRRHDLGPNFWEKNFDGTIQKEFMTAPLWGVGATAPYGHDGRSPTLRDVILRHGGDAQLSRNRFANLHPAWKREIEDFLRKLVLFSPPSTASNLNPGDPATPDYPVDGHGSIDLGALFNDPTDKE